MSTTVLHHAPRLAGSPVQTAAAPSFWRRVWNALEDAGQRRATAELRRYAALHASTDPDLSRRLRELADTPAPRG